MWVAASVDEALRAKVLPLETRFARVVHATTVDLLGLDETQPGVRETVMTILDLARGLGLADVLSDDAVRRAAVLRQFAKLLDPNTQHPLTLVSAATLATTRKALP